ncbi:hypothetical protein [Amycolatopsis benzoatilytica]|uniref:hypothetical protein n=1 Tax=Amycolatopsis benzoatilytica TaxID=346045 RepID=UPI00037CF70F|nr:hypothetical protein [Amycolatopsis benzoatilytica]
MTVDFETTYRRHVAMVVEGDRKGILNDMAPGSVPSVFRGVNVPQDKVGSAEVVAVRVEGDRATGEAVYRTPDGPIGLRSGWGLVDGEWKADGLENFPAGDE